MGHNYSWFPTLYVIVREQQQQKNLNKKFPNKMSYEVNPFVKYIWSQRKWKTIFTHHENLGLEFWIASLTGKLCTQIFSLKGVLETCYRCGLSHKFLLFLPFCQHSLELLLRSCAGSLIFFSLLLFFAIIRYSFSTALAITSLAKSLVSSLPVKFHFFFIWQMKRYSPSLIPAQPWESCLYEGISHFVALT